VIGAWLAPTIGRRLAIGWLIGLVVSVLAQLSQPEGVPGLEGA